MLPVVILDQERQLALFRWGLIPFWADDPSIGNRLINARAETIAQKPSFRDAFKKRRCLVPADSFYEWQKTDSGKQPTRIMLRSEEPFAFAGLWEHWKSPEGQEIYSYTIITTSPNELVAPVHNRMPVVLPRDGEGAWLDPQTHPADLHELLQPFDATKMQLYPVTTLINSPSNNSPEVLQRANVGGGGSDVGSW